LSLAGAKKEYSTFAFTISLGIYFVAAPDILKCFLQIVVEQAKLKGHAPYAQSYAPGG